jgi:hypothetical protein
MRLIDCTLRTTGIRYISYLGQCISIKSDYRVALDVLESFLGSHFEFSEEWDGTVFANVSITRKSCPISLERFASGERVFLRQSASAYFTIEGQRVVDVTGEHVRCTRSGSIISFCGVEVTAYIPFDGFALDVIELVRDLFSKRLESIGVVVLHSTVLERNGQAALVIGRKGAGKTTMALRLVTEHGFRFVSGDKAVVSVADEMPYVSGWPDYPHIGAGTLKSMPVLADALGVGREYLATLPDTHKMALDPGLFRRFVPHASQTHYPVRCVLYPDVASRLNKGITPLHQHADRLIANIETASADTWEWNQSQHPPSDRTHTGIAELARLDAWQIDGPLLNGTKWFDDARVNV